MSASSLLHRTQWKSSNKEDKPCLRWLITQTKAKAIFYNTNKQQATHKGDINVIKYQLIYLLEPCKRGVYLKY